MREQKTEQVVRDPRVDPEAGDVLLREERRQVIKVHPEEFYENRRQYDPSVTFMYSRGISNLSIESWREWAKDAEVIHTAGSEESK